MKRNSLIGFVLGSTLLASLTMGEIASAQSAVTFTPTQTTTNDMMVTQSRFAAWIAAAAAVVVSAVEVGKAVVAVTEVVSSSSSSSGGAQWTAQVAQANFDH